MKKFLKPPRGNRTKTRRDMTQNEKALRRSFRNAFLAVFVLLGIVGTGSISYIIIERMSPLDALWMTVITMSTVGFGEVTPLDAAGRILTIAIILATIMVGGYAIGNIGAFIFGGEVLNIMKGRRLEKEIERLSGHIILIGYGRVGKEAAEEWSADNLVVVEQNHETVIEAQKDGHLTIEGDSTNDATLLNAGIERASGIMIATGDIAHNVLISLTARELNPDIIISARGDDNRSESRLKRAGANMVVLPHKIGGRRMAAFLKHPHVVDFFDMVMQRDDLSLRLQEFKVKHGSCLIGKTLKEADIRKTTNGTLIMAIRTQVGALLVPAPPNYSIEEDDLLIGLGTDVALQKLEILTEKG